jgi:hypothetical protein
MSFAVMVDRNGMLNAASLDLSAGTGWQGPECIGNGSLVPGSPVTVLRESATLFSALMVDRNGMLNAASLDLSAGTGWQGPECIGNGSLVPGSPVTVLRQSATLFSALMVDRNGMLNAASLDLSAGTGWQGPECIGNGSLVPGSPVHS